MQDDRGKSVRQAPPGTPVSITGWREVPSAGDQLLEAVHGEDEAKRAITNRLREAERRKLQADAEQINVKRREERIRAEAEEEEIKAIRQAGGNIFQAQLSVAKKAAEVERSKTYKELRLVIKADVSGTVEAVVGSLEGIGNKEAGVKIVHTGVGEVGDSDVSLAQAAEGESTISHKTFADTPQPSSLASTCPALARSRVPPRQTMSTCNSNPSSTA